MNTVTIQTAPTEAPAANRQTKLKSEAESGEFRGMLTGALQTNGNGKTGKAGKNEATAAEKAAGRSEKPKAKTPRADEAKETPNSEAMSAMTQQAAEAETQDTAVTDEPAATPGGQPEQALKAITAQDVQISRKIPEQSAEKAIPPETRERQTGGGQTTVQDSFQADEWSRQAAELETQAAERSQSRQGARTRTETAAIPREAEEDVVSAKAVTQAPEPVPVERTRPVISQDGEGNARFGEMLTKASRELGQGRTAAQAEAPEESGSPVIEETDLTREEPQNAADTEAKPAPHAAVREVPARTEQRPLRETPKTDEAARGLIQPKPDVTAPGVELREPVPEAQPVRTPDQAEQIRAQVIENLEEEKLEFHMQLQPKELGRVDVKMVLESGRLAMEIVAANPKSTELLSKQIDGLMASLRLGGIEVSSVNVVTARQDADSQMAQMDNPYHSGDFQNQTGGESGRSGSSGSGGAGQDGTDYTEAQPDETRGSPQRLLNYSV